jgi:aerobic-type carbon monoxide dehydrogenase small subunit (CoxS/CutS family)
MESLPQDTLRIAVNGRSHTLQVEPRWTLLHLLREVMDLTGAKTGCDRGECGACTVLLNGAPVYSCMLLALQAQGAAVTTVEGLGTPEHLNPVQEAFVQEDGAQCGFCTPGFILSAEALLRRSPAPTEEDVRRALAGNLCRCNAYGRILAAVMRASQLRGGNP